MEVADARHWGGYSWCGSGEGHLLEEWLHVVDGCKLVVGVFVRATLYHLGKGGEAMDELILWGHSWDGH